MKAKVWAVVILGLMVMSGCGPRPQSDAGKSVEQVRAQAEKMSAPKLERQLQAYDGHLQKIRQEIDRVKEEAKKLDVKQLFGAEGEKLKQELSRLKGDYQTFQERRRIYQTRLTQLSLK